MLGVYVTMEMIMCDIFTHSVNVVHYINDLNTRAASNPSWSKFFSSLANHFVESY